MPGIPVICKESGEQFEVSATEAEFLSRRGLPLPVSSPTERARRRLTFRNQRHLFRRNCSATGKPLISMFAPEYPGPVVTSEYWWSDAWDPFSFGREFDFTRPFFPQFQELFVAVPQLCTMVSRSENCEYNAYCATSRNCYMCQSVAESDNVYYTFGPTRTRDSLDSHTLDTCELCFETLFAHNSYNLRYCQNVNSCSDSSYLLNCSGCRNCAFCVNLRNAEYHFENEPLSPQDYAIKLAEVSRLSSKERLSRFKRFSDTQPVPASWGANSENARGNQIFNSRNVENGFDVVDCEDVGYAWRVYSAKNAYDCLNIYGGEDLYQITSGFRSNRARFCLALYDNVYDAEYSAYCYQSSHDLFGCVGLRHTEYSILNVKYKPDEFRKLREKIIAHMQETGEWGQFFPSSISPFAYNNTLANDLFPLTKEQAVSRGLSWRDPEPEAAGDGIPASALPADASSAGEEICRNIYLCAECSRGFRIQKAELLLAQKLQVELPKSCFECRHKSRLGRIDPGGLYKRSCSSCNSAIETCWSDASGKTVLCERCYLNM